LFGSFTGLSERAARFFIKSEREEGERVREKRERELERRERVKKAFTPERLPGSFLTRGNLPCYNAPPPKGRS
jgi:hypothetical protein